MQLQYKNFVVNELFCKNFVVNELFEEHKLRCERTSLITLRCERTFCTGFGVAYYFFALLFLQKLRCERSLLHLALFLYTSFIYAIIVL